MIPLKLSVRNFLCYRDDVPPLDLRGIHVACLCGANGHGKSALLDAMTWCLWGQARTGSQNYNDLIAYGETECRVELDFLARGQTCRVIRRRRASGQGRTEVDLFIVDDADVVRPVTGNSVRETNAAIQRLVGMDYNTFVNTAFLLQGRSDEFTRKNPSDRKTVLSSVLGLELYDIWQSAARNQRDQWQDNVTRTDGALSQSKSALNAVPDPTDELAAVAQRLTALATDLDAASTDVDRHRVAVAELRRKRDELVAAEQRISSLTKDIEQAEVVANAIAERIANARALLERSAEIRVGVLEMEQARAELNRLEEARSEHDRLSNRRRALQASIDREHAALSAELDQLMRRLTDDIEPQAARAPEITGQLAELAGAEQSLLNDQNTLDADTAAVAALRGEITLQEAELARCVSEGKELRTKQTEMQSADSICPLCRTPLSEDACGNISQWYKTEIQAKLRLHGEIKQALTDLTGRRDQLTDSTENKRKRLAERQRQIQQDRGRLEQEQRQSDDARKQLLVLRPRLEQLRVSLEAGDYGAAERAEVAQIDREIVALDYDDADREKTYREAQSLQHWDIEQRELNSALSRLPDDENELRRNREQVDRWEEEMRTVETARAADVAALAGLPAFERELGCAEARVQQLSAERDDLLARQGRLQGDAERRTALSQELAALQRRRNDAQLEQSIYADLFAAFGRSGVPAMLIDAAVPRIEAEANHLLGRMTDNRLALKLETQRDRRDGRVAETLDILISDELGARSYDLFSGGEAFRINLALRIALSKVLAQRTGLPLPTLFIDEGFGTQDAAGRERIVDAIASIQDDFEKIIVITHLEELKDLFPVRIEVMKTAAGSQFWLS